MTSREYSSSNQNDYQLSQIAPVRSCRETLIIGTSFPLHTEQMIQLIIKNPEKIDDASNNLTVALSDRAYEELRSIIPNVTYVTLPSRGALSLTFDLASILKLRRFRFSRIILLYHDNSFLRNRRAETLALLCHAHSYHLSNIKGDTVQLTFTSLLRKLLFGTYDGSWLDRFLFISYMHIVRFRALWTITGRRSLLSRWKK